MLFNLLLFKKLRLLPDKALVFNNMRRKYADASLENQKNNQMRFRCVQEKQKLEDENKALKDTLKAYSEITTDDQNNK